MRVLPLIYPRREVGIEREADHPQKNDQDLVSERDHVAETDPAGIDIVRRPSAKMRRKPRGDENVEESAVDEERRTTHWPKNHLERNLRMEKEMSLKTDLGQHHHPTRSAPVTEADEIEISIGTAKVRGTINPLLTSIVRLTAHHATMRRIGPGVETGVRSANGSGGTDTATVVANLKSLYLNLTSSQLPCKHPSRPNPPLDVPQLSRMVSKSKALALAIRAPSITSRIYQPALAQNASHPRHEIVAVITKSHGRKKGTSLAVTIAMKTTDLPATSPPVATKIANLPRLLLLHPLKPRLHLQRRPKTLMNSSEKLEIARDC